MDKKAKLAVLGVAAFIAVLLVVLFLTGFFNPPQAKADPVPEAFSAVPYFIDELRKEDPALAAKGFVVKQRYYGLRISDSGFSETELIIYPQNLVSMMIKNDDNLAHNVVVLSPDKAGKLHSLAEATLNPGEMKGIAFVVPEFLKELALSGKVQLLKTKIEGETGEFYTIFEIYCNLNCSEEKGKLKIYAPLLQ
jgi:hypothetical protein